jgi:hypothetical protein
MTQDDQDPYESTTRWMLESGRRRAIRAPDSLVELIPRSRLPGQERTFLGIGREIWLFAVLAGVYLNYYFMQVETEIYALESVLFFVRSS